MKPLEKKWLRRQSLQFTRPSAPVGKHFVDKPQFRLTIRWSGTLEGDAKIGYEKIFVTWNETVDGDVILGDVDGLLEYVRGYADEMENGDTQSFEIRREDMTEGQIKAIPVV